MRWTSPPAGWPRRCGAYGPDAVGFYLSGQLLTEDYEVFNKLARALAGTNNIDTNSRPVHVERGAGYKRTLGADAPPACYDDLKLADTRADRRFQHGLGAPSAVSPAGGREGRPAAR